MNSSYSSALQQLMARTHIEQQRAIPPQPSSPAAASSSLDFWLKVSAWLHAIIIAIISILFLGLCGIALQIYGLAKALGINDTQFLQFVEGFLGLGQTKGLVQLLFSSFPIAIHTISTLFSYISLVIVTVSLFRYMGIRAKGNGFYEPKTQQITAIILITYTVMIVTTTLAWFPF
jgi:hypothetical protein